MEIYRKILIRNNLRKAYLLCFMTHVKHIRGSMHPIFLEDSTIKC